MQNIHRGLCWWGLRLEPCLAWPGQRQPGAHWHSDCQWLSGWLWACRHRAVTPGWARRQDSTEYESGLYLVHTASAASESESRVRGRCFCNSSLQEKPVCRAGPEATASLTLSDSLCCLGAWESRVTVTSDATVTRPGPRPGAQPQWWPRGPPAGRQSLCGAYAIEGLSDFNLARARSAVKLLNQSKRLLTKRPFFRILVTLWRYAQGSIEIDPLSDLLSFATDYYY